MHEVGWIFFFHLKFCWAALRFTMIEFYKIICIKQNGAHDIMIGNWCSRLKIIDGRHGELFWGDLWMDETSSCRAKKKLIEISEIDYFVWEIIPKDVLCQVAVWYLWDFVRKKRDIEQLYRVEVEFCLSKSGVWKHRLAMLSCVLCTAWSIFTLVGILTIFGYFCRSGAIDVVKSLWSSSLECSGILVTVAFPRRCCGIAVVSRRLLKHQKLPSF